MTTVPTAALTATAPAVTPGLAAETDQACLVIHGPDRPGIVAAVSALIARHGGNIVTLDQYSDDPEGGGFFQRVVFHRQDLRVAFPEIEADLTATLGPLKQQWRLTDQSTPKRMAILASQSDHCLLDLLWRHRRGELPVSIPMVISNHTNLAEDVRSFGVPFLHIPSQGPDKSAAEARIVEALAGNADFVVLARYMQILSSDFLSSVGVPVINIHHSFLPAFIGAAPYRKAKERGVKLIGATSHYVTEDLDEGPIIEQDVVRVTHADSAADLQRRGADVERAVLSRAVLWHAQDRVIRHGNHTIIF
jgi:formyltetrahydrofolate deformylase